jgi:hypothetical protein
MEENRRAMSNVLEKISSRKHATWETVMDGENGAIFRYAARHAATEFTLVAGSVDLVLENALENLHKP